MVPCEPSWVQTLPDSTSRTSLQLHWKPLYLVGFVSATGPGIGTQWLGSGTGQSRGVGEGWPCSLNKFLCVSNKGCLSPSHVLYVCGGSVEGALLLAKSHNTAKTNKTVKKKAIIQLQWLTKPGSRKARNGSRDGGNSPAMQGRRPFWGISSVTYMAALAHMNR